MNILALDLGTKCGWAMSRNGHVTFGTMKLGLTKKEKEKNPGLRYLRFKSEVVELLQTEFDLVLYEDVKRHLGTEAAHVYGGLRAILQMMCEDRMVDYEGIGVGTIKKSFTGKGNAKKPQMIHTAREKGYHVTDDNQADAIALLLLGLKRNGE
jgi:crossover junction endodeoxyribonuclease RuvC